MISQPTRRAFVAGTIAFGFSAANATEPDAMSIGDPNAPLQLVEYASMTCPHCAHFHENNWALLKSRYIDTGRMRLTLQEMLTQPAQAAFGMFQLARAGGAQAPEYFRRVSILFDRQSTIFQAQTVDALVTQLTNIGAEWGLTADQVMSSLRDPSATPRMNRSIEAADAAGVRATPTFFLNGQLQPNNFQLTDVLTRTLDAALAR